MKFVIFTHPFEEHSGGVIALHLLAQRLNDAGETALLWPFSRTRLRLRSSPRQYLAWLRDLLTRRHRRFERGPFATRLARASDLDDAIAVYPEVFSGNPLGTRTVARWLLHKPGFHTGKVDFGRDDLIFFYQQAFADPAMGGHADNLLTLTWWNDAYSNRHLPDRSGSAYLVRKGKGRALVHDPTDSICIDALSHEKKAVVFNKSTYFFTYDPYTLYSRYAAICGCIPVVIPPDGLSKEEWVPSEEDRYGLAYGVKEIPWAIATRDLLLERIVQERAEEDAMLHAFIAKCRARYERNPS